jgi:hypothetical protein
MSSPAKMATRSSSRTPASESHVFVLSCAHHKSDNPNRARECDRLESLRQAGSWQGLKSCPFLSARLHKLHTRPQSLVPPISTAGHSLILLETMQAFSLLPLSIWFASVASGVVVSVEAKQQCRLQQNICCPKLGQAPPVQIIHQSQCLFRYVTFHNTVHLWNRPNRPDKRSQSVPVHQIYCFLTDF